MPTNYLKYILSKRNGYHDQIILSKKTSNIFILIIVNSYMENNYASLVMQPKCTIGLRLKKKRGPRISPLLAS